MIRIGLIVDNRGIPSPILDLIRWSHDSRHYQITCLIVQSKYDKKYSKVTELRNYLKTNGAVKFLRYFSWLVVSRIDQTSLHFSKTLRGRQRMHPLSDCGLPKIVVKPIISKSGVIHRFRQQDLENIRQQDCDALIRCGSGILRGEILNLCRFGIISFHHANNDVNRGMPPGFWESYNKDKSTGFIIQKLTDELDGGDVLVRGRIRTSFLFSINRERIIWKSIVFLHDLLENIGKTHKLPKTEENKPYSYPLYSMPKIYQQLGYLLIHAVPFLLGMFIDSVILRRKNRWNVAFQFASDWRKGVLWRSTIIKNPPYHFLADPFVWSESGKIVCFVEDYDYRAKRGSIAAYDLKENSYEFIGTVLQEPFHLSYPYVFRWNDEIFMCPETNEIDEIRLYKCDQFPTEWSYYKTLLPNMSAVDTSIFEHENRWWMFTNIDSSDLREFFSELHIYYSDRPDSDNWTPHPQNPVYVDSERARNGGLILQNGEIFRVFQVQGYEVYGESMGVCKVMRLTESEYEEEVVAEIPPKFFLNLTGTHSLSFNDGVLAFDFARKERVTK